MIDDGQLLDVLDALGVVESTSVDGRECDVRVKAAHRLR